MISPWVDGELSEKKELNAFEENFFLYPQFLKSQ